jgi:tRNA modification GTPase
MRIVDQILAALIGSGARLARPGEFTQRAFENGKLDLTQAEAVIDLIQARSERALNMARQTRSGSLTKAIASLQDQLLNHLAHLEAYIDFPDEDITPEVGLGLQNGVETLIASCDQILGTAREGRLLRHGVTVVLAGEPNAGKSSLLNALIEEDRAIVSPVPGTTRDTIDASLLLAGIPLTLVDTAGLRETTDLVEQLGVARTKAAAGQADLLLWVQDGTTPPPPLPSNAFPTDIPRIICRTKVDLPNFIPGPGLALSSITGQGLPELKTELSTLLRLTDTGGEHLVAINRRQEEVLQRARTSLSQALQELTEGLPPELTATSLRIAQQALGEIVGLDTNEDVLDRLFQTFCIGK